MNVINVKKTISMDVLIDLSMTKLFLLAEYVCNNTPFSCGRKLRPQSITSLPSKDVASTIRFSNEDKNAIKSVESDDCISSFERAQSRLKNKMVEGELFECCLNEDGK